MHAYIATRGQKDKVDRFISDLQAQYFPYEAINPATKKKENFILQMGVRPMQIWEITFPEKCIDSALSILNPNPNSWNKSYDKFIFLFRKFLGLKPIPKFTPREFPTRKDIEILGIGIKEDRYLDGIEQI